MSLPIAIAMNEANCSDIIVQLKQKPFSSLPFEDKLAIIQTGRPCPPLINLNCKVTEKSRSYNRHFTVSNYESYNWMCGSEHLSKLFCWPCLLFSKSSNKNIWTVSGFSNLSGLTKSAKSHEKSESHLQCVIDLYNFGKQRVDEGLNNALKVNNTVHNQKVKKNREILKRLIDVTCFLAKQELPFRGHNEKEGSVNRGNYIETLNLLKRWDPVLNQHLETATVFKGTSSDIQNDLISVMSDIVNETIVKEIEKSNFVAVLLDETSDVRSRSQLSTVLRYVNRDKGVVKERFLGFSDISADRTANGLFKHVTNIVEMYKLENKFIAQTYDGASVMSGHLSGLQSKVKERYPMALFTHCYAHVLNLVLCQGMNGIPECNVFFTTLNGVSTFSSHSSKRTFAVQEYLKKSIPSFAPTRWCFTSRLVNTVETYREHIVQFFSNIHENIDGHWNADDMCKAYGYMQFLEHFQNVFLLNTFSPLFVQTDIIFNILQCEHFDVMTCLNAIRDFENHLITIRKGFVHCVNCTKMLAVNKITEDQNCDNCDITGFKPVWGKTVCMVGPPSHSLKRKHTEIDKALTPEEKYRKLYYEIIDNLLGHLKERFTSLKDLQFFELLNLRKFKVFSNTKHFPEILLSEIQGLYPNIFDLQGLKNELSVIYRTVTFQNKSPQQLLQFLKEEHLENAFNEVFRLAELISTIPATTASVERSFSALKRIHTYKRSTQREERMSNLAMLSIEKELLETIRDGEDFYNSVIQKFVLKTRRMELLYK